MPILQCELWECGTGFSFQVGLFKWETHHPFIGFMIVAQVKSSKLIQNAVQKYNHQENNADIDLLVLSHFGKDHLAV